MKKTPLALILLALLVFPALASAQQPGHTITAFSGIVAADPGQTYQVLLYIGDSKSAGFNTERKLVAKTETDSSGAFVLVATDLPTTSAVTIRAKNSALSKGGDVVVAPPANGAWPDVTGDLGIQPVPQSDPNFGIRLNRYASKSMYFVTDRAVSGTTFSNTADPQNVMRFGTFQAHVALGSGQAVPHQCGLAATWSCGAAPVRNDDAYIDGIATRGTTEDPKSALASVLSAPEGNTILLFVHGYNNSFAQGAEKAARLSYLMEPAKHTTILFSWPSESKVSGYPQDQKSAQLSARQHLTGLLDVLAKAPTHPRIILAAHSMGSYAITTALDHWATAHPDAQATFSQLVLFAGDVDSQLFATERSGITRVVKQVKIYANQNDQALAMSTCATGDNRQRVGQVVEWTAPLGFFNATPFASTNGFGHGYLVESLSVAANWNKTVDPSPPATLMQTLRRTPWLADGGGGWINTGKLEAEVMCRIFRKLP